MSVAVGVIAVLVWFVPAVLTAQRSVPPHPEVILHTVCVSGTSGPPNYGSREPVSFCVAR